MPYPWPSTRESASAECKKRPWRERCTPPVRRLLMTVLSPTVIGNGTDPASFTAETARDGKTNPMEIGILMAWHTPNGQWQLLARQAVKLEAPRTNGATNP